MLAASASQEASARPNNGMGGDLFQMDERVRVLKSAARPPAKQARLIAQKAPIASIFRICQHSASISASLRSATASNECSPSSGAEQQETEALREAVPRLEMEIASLKQQVNSSGDSVFTSISN